MHLEAPAVHGAGICEQIDFDNSIANERLSTFDDGVSPLICNAMNMD